MFLGEMALEERASGVGLVRQYVPGAGGRPAAVIDIAGGRTVSFLLGDGRGRIAGAADARGGFLFEVEYDVLGAPVFLDATGYPISAQNAVTANAVLHGVTGWEPGARLFVLRGRAWSPALGRWIERGSPRLSAEPLAMNPYAVLDPVGGFPRPGGMEEPMRGTQAAPGEESAVGAEPHTRQPNIGQNWRTENRELGAPGGARSRSSERAGSGNEFPSFPVSRSLFSVHQFDGADHYVNAYGAEPRPDRAAPKAEDFLPR